MSTKFVVLRRLFKTCTNVILGGGRVDNLSKKGSKQQFKSPPVIIFEYLRSGSRSNSFKKNLVYLCLVHKYQGRSVGMN